MVREGDLTWDGEHTQYNKQMMYYRIVYLNLYNFTNQCHPSKFDKNSCKFLNCYIHFYLMYFMNQIRLCFLFRPSRTL